MIAPCTIVLGLQGQEHTQYSLRWFGPAGLRHSAAVMQLLRESPQQREWRSLQARTSFPDMCQKGLHMFYCGACVPAGHPPGTSSASCDEAIHQHM